MTSNRRTFFLVNVVDIIAVILWAVATIAAFVNFLAGSTSAGWWLLMLGCVPFAIAGVINLALEWRRGE